MYQVQKKNLFKDEGEIKTSFSNIKTSRIKQTRTTADLHYKVVYKKPTVQGILTAHNTTRNVKFFSEKENYTR